MSEQRTKIVNRGGGNAVYGLGLIGAAVYFLQHAGSFWEGAAGLVKALLWPAFVVFSLMSHMRM